jgi:hypothetical protein
VLAAAGSGQLPLLVVWIGLTALTSLTRGCQGVWFSADEALKTQCVMSARTAEE